MIYLCLSAICAATLVLLFKYFERNHIPVFPAIVVNYCTAALFAILFLPDKQALVNLEIFSRPWLWLSIITGVSFITVFYLTSLTTLHFGVSTASVASKLGLVLPVLLAFTFYGESFNFLKLLGIVFALVSVILSSINESPATEEEQVALKHGNKHKHAYLPMVVFIGSGICDSMTQLANKKYLANSGNEEFALFIFLSAAVAGVLAFLYQLKKHRDFLNIKSLTGGIVLGIVNYFSFLFILRALGTVKWGSSVVFPLNNLGVVAFATVAGIILFKEKITPVNMLGLAFAAASIIVILLSNS